MIKEKRLTEAEEQERKELLQKASSNTRWMHEHEQKRLEELNTKITTFNEKNGIKYNTK